MNSRRKFLLQGSMATTALLISNPFQTIADAGFPIEGLTGTTKKITFLHTGNLAGLGHDEIRKDINACKNNSDVVLLDATAITTDAGINFAYDASISKTNPVSGTANNFRIIYKGNIKIGVVSAIPADADVISQINNLSDYLKKDRNCHFVVCLSQLGYKNKNKIDDRSLAEASTSLDLIIGGDTTNHSKQPAILLNKNNAEVVISHSTGKDPALSQVEVAFNKLGNKNGFAFNNAFQS